MGNTRKKKAREFLPFYFRVCAFSIQRTRLSRSQEQGITLIIILNSFSLEQFSYVLEIKTRERNRNKKRTEIERFDWFIERIHAWLLVGYANARVKKIHARELSEINRYSLTSHYNTIGQSNNAFSILRFSLAGKGRGPVLVFSFIA